MSSTDSSSARRNARKKLALRAERAFGLTVVQRAEDDADEAQPAVARSISAASTIATTTNTTRIAQRPDGPKPFLAPPPKAQPVQRKSLAVPSINITEPFTSPILSIDEKRERLSALNQNEVRGCTRCRLCEARTQTVFGEGNFNAKLMFIGEGPGADEDEQGRPFVGRSGQLLEKQINAMGLTRDEVFIANVVKCRPPDNRTPTPDEVATCTPYLERQIEIIRPRVIVTLGLPASQHMLQTKISMSKMRGTWRDWRGIKIMPTFHPAYLLRSYTKENRAMVWSDLQRVMVELGLPITK